MFIKVYFPIKTTISEDDDRLVDSFKTIYISINDIESVKIYRDDTIKRAEFNNLNINIYKEIYFEIKLKFELENSFHVLNLSQIYIPKSQNSSPKSDFHKLEYTNQFLSFDHFYRGKNTEALKKIAKILDFNLPNNYNSDITDYKSNNFIPNNPIIINPIK
jgi:hypothetical protein